MFDFYTKWKLRKELEKRANRKISDSYLESQRSIYARRRNEDTSTIDVMNYMLLNNLLDLSTGTKLPTVEVEKLNSSEVHWGNQSTSVDPDLSYRSTIAANKIDNGNNENGNKYRGSGVDEEDNTSKVSSSSYKDNSYSSRNSDYEDNSRPSGGGYSSYGGGSSSYDSGGSSGGSGGGD